MSTFVKVAKLGTPSIDVVVDDNMTIEEILDDQEVDYNDSDGFTINGRVAQLDTVVSVPENTVAVLMITPTVKGGSDPFFIKVGYTGGTTQQICVNDTFTVAMAVEAAGLDLTNKTIALDSNPASAGTLLVGTNKLILLSSAVKGGQKA